MTEQHRAALISVQGVQHDHPVIVDGVERPGFLFDTDPFVVGICANLNDGTVLTAAIPRTVFPLLQIASVSSATQIR